MLTWLEISKKNLLLNNKTIREAIDPKVKLITVIKSNAYGHGMLQVANVLKKYTDWFGVASLDEAFELRENKIKNPVIVLSFFDADSKKIREAIEQKITFPVYTLQQAKTLDKAAYIAREKVSVHVKVDTGTSRVGQRPENFANFVQSLKRFTNLKVTGLYSHFADSEKNYSYTKKQLDWFKAVKEIALKNYSPLDCHIACSAATVLHKISHYDCVRAGIMTYGLYPSKKTRLKPKNNDSVGGHLKLKPVLTWITKVIQVKDLPRNTYVGYGLSYKTKRRIRMAVLPVGYADGYARKLSNAGTVLVNGKKTRVIGRVCMNLTMIDVTGLPTREGDAVVLLGRQGKQEITADEIADKVGTINYEIVTRINWKLPRIVV